MGRFLCAEFHVRAESSKDGRPLVSEMEGMAQAVACRYSRALVALLGTFGRGVVLINGWSFGFFEVFTSDYSDFT